MAGKKQKGGKRFKLEKPDKPIKIKSSQDNSDDDNRTSGKVEPGWLITGLTNAARAVRSNVSSAVGDLGLYAGQEQIILALADTPGSTLGELALKIGVRPPTVTKAITRMEARGFVQRVPSKTDARVVLVRLTEKGADCASSLQIIMNQIEDDILSDLKKSERKGLVKGLTAVNARLDDL